MLPPRMCKPCKCLRKQEDGCTRQFSPVVRIAAALLVAYVKASSTQDAVPVGNVVPIDTMSKKEAYFPTVSSTSLLPKVLRVLISLPGVVDFRGTYLQFCCCSSLVWNFPLRKEMKLGPFSCGWATAPGHLKLYRLSFRFNSHSWLLTRQL